MIRYPVIAAIIIALALAFGAYEVEEADADPYNPCFWTVGFAAYAGMCTPEQVNDKWLLNWILTDEFIKLYPKTAAGTPLFDQVDYPCARVVLPEEYDLHGGVFPLGTPGVYIDWSGLEGNIGRPDIEAVWSNLRNDPACRQNPIAIWELITGRSFVQELINRGVRFQSGDIASVLQFFYPR